MEENIGRPYAKREEMRNAYKSLAKKPERKSPFDRLCNRCEDNIKMNLKEIHCEVMNLIPVPLDNVQ
jgi:hypothetical protein